MPAQASQVARRQLASMAVIAVTELQKQRFDWFDLRKAVRSPFPPLVKDRGIVLIDELEIRWLASLSLQMLSMLQQSSTTGVSIRKQPV